MPSVSDLSDFVMRVASLNTSDTTESTLVLRWLNNAYQRAVGLTGVFSYDSSVSPSANSDVILKTAYSPASSVTQGVVSVRHVYLDYSGSGGTGRQLERVSLEELLRLRTSDQVSTYDGPLKFAVRGDGDIELWPATASGNVFTIETDLLPLTLVSSAPGSGQESTPTAIPSMFHYDVLANPAIANAFEYRGLQAQAGYFRGLAQQGLRDLHSWLNEQGSITGPQVKVVRGNAVQTMPDQRW